MGTRTRTARNRAGTDPQIDGARFVARARLLEEVYDAPAVVANDVCDIMGESGTAHVNSCDEWRENGAYSALRRIRNSPTAARPSRYKPLKAVTSRYKSLQAVTRLSHW